MRAPETALVGLDEGFAAEAEAGPVFVDGDGADGVKAGGVERGPAGVAVEITLMFLGCAFGIGEPQGGITGGARDELCREGVNLFLFGDEGEREGDDGQGLNGAVEVQNGQAGELAVEVRRGVEDEDLQVIFELEFLVEGRHGFLW